MDLQTDCLFTLQCKRVSITEGGLLGEGKRTEVNVIHNVGRTG